MLVNRYVLSTIFAVILLAGIVQAAGIAAPYWDTPGNENPLYLTKRESKVVNFELQNMVGSSDLTFKVTLDSKENVVKFANNQDTYSVPAGQRIEVPIEVTVPPEAQLENSYKIKVLAQEVKSGEAGQFSLGSAFENSFDLIVAQPPAKAQQKKASDSMYIFYLIIGIAAVGLVIYALNRRK